MRDGHHQPARLQLPDRSAGRPAGDLSLSEETIADRLPTQAHATWLGTPAGELVKTVHQRFMDPDGRVIMISDVSYPLNRYDAFVFRMALTGDDES